MTQLDTKAPHRFLTPTKDITELRVFFTQARPTSKSRVNNRFTGMLCKILIFLLSWFAFYLYLLLIDFFHSSPCPYQHLLNVPISVQIACPAPFLLLLIDTFWTGTGVLL